MDQYITITEKGRTYQVRAGQTLDQLAASQGPWTRHPVGALVDGCFRELDFPLEQDAALTWADYDCRAGWRVYSRSMVFLLVLAVGELFPERRLLVSHSLAEGLYCRLDPGPVTAEDTAALARLMESYIQEDIPITRVTMTKAQAAALFRSQGQPGRAALVERQPEPTVDIYEARGRREYFFGHMVTRGGVLGYFDLKPYGGGFVLHLPTREYLGCRPFDVVLVRQLQSTLEGYDYWSSCMGVSTVEDLNQVVRQGPTDFLELIQVSETLYEGRLHEVSSQIAARFPTVRLVLIAGPSSSGKTTTSRRLAVHFRTLCIRPVYISMDDYFLDRDKTPLLPDGSYDFESIRAMNMDLFHENMRDLLAGKEAALPHYDFQTGKSMPAFRKVSLGDDRILIVEGIHALNDLVSAGIPREMICKLFVSALTQLNYDDYSPVPASDARLVRRMARDMQFRGIDPENTLLRWDEVRRGEHQNIFPWQESADYFINSALLYETPVLRPLVEPALTAVEPGRESYGEVQRMLHFLRCFEPAPPDQVPGNSLLREFIGGSVFDV